MNLLHNITDYVAVNGETHRNRLALLGRHETDSGMISSGFFRSPFNNVGNLGQEVVRREDGTVREVILKYLPRAVESEVATNFTGLCTAGSELDYFETSVTPANFSISRQKITIEADNWDLVCESIPDIIGRRWMAQINALNQQAEGVMAGQIIAGTGANAGITAAPTNITDPALIAEYRSLDLIDSDSMPIWAGVDSFETDMALNEVSDVPAAVLFGLTNPFKTFVHSQKVGCCNDKGQDITQVVEQLNNIAPFRGRKIQDAFVTAGLSASDAAGAAIVLHPGSAHLIEYFDFDRAPYVHGSSYGSTWIDPISGEKYDVKVEFVPCGSGTSRKGQYVINIYKQYKVFTMPTDQYKSGDAKENQNGIMLYQFT